MTRERELLEQSLTALSADHHFGDYAELCAAIRAHLAAQPAPAEPVACLIRYRGCTPARAARDGQRHWHDWSDWQVATLEHGQAVTHPARNPTEDDEWQMQLLYRHPAAQPAPVPVGYISKTGHGTYFRETITPELAALEFGGRKMWTPVVPAHAAAPVPVPLTDEQIVSCWESSTGHKMPNMGTSKWQLLAVARAIERAHGVAASPEKP